jgi:hypothetical protein
VRGAKAQKSIAINTKNKTSSKPTRLSIKSDKLHWKIAEKINTSISRNPRTGKINREFMREPGVDGRGSFIVYSRSVSSGSIQNLSTSQAHLQDHALLFYA